MYILIMKNIIKKVLVSGLLTVVLSACTNSTASVNSAAASTENSAKSSYTLSEVESHNQASNCWSAINGNVYNLTSWVNIHPGGADMIVSICGKDGSDSYNSQHGSARKPAKELANFLIGSLQ